MCGSSLAANGSARETRKYVSVLFIDIVGSTSLAERLDPEALRQIMDHYFARCSGAVAAHGGLVEKYIGDAVLAVFGADVSHEDDALRAVRAAADSLRGLGELNPDLAASHRETLAARCGICSGEAVVVTFPGGDFRVVGDLVNTASRLQNAAGAGEILVDHTTANLVKIRAHLEPVAPLTLRGKASPVRAWRVVAPEPPQEIPAERLGRFIGRVSELTEMRQAFRRVSQQRRPYLMTLLGVPGIGKSRLVREFCGIVRDQGATVMTGRCSAYGRGDTYQPLTEVLNSYPGGWGALSRVARADSERGPLAVERLASLLERGAPGDQPPGVEEIAWSARWLLEVLGESGPVIVVWEDLHRAEETLLDLIDDIASWLADVPVLMLCVARPELFDGRPTWGGGKPCALTLDLPPLTLDESAELVSDLALRADVSPHEHDEFYSQVAVQCDGNPLFVELMLDVFGDGAPGPRVPPTIQALLGARLDQLDHAERHVLERAALIGREFSRTALIAMAAADGVTEPDTRSVVNMLAHRRLIGRGSSPEEFRFAQALLQDTAYTLTPKSRRERWHQFMAHWLAGRLTPGRDRAAQGSAMALAYHVEAAVALRRELRPGDASLPDLAAEAAQILITEGDTALRRRDLPAAATLLERGRDLLPVGDARHLTLALRICDPWIRLWREERALAAVAHAEASLAGARHAALTCEIQRLIIALRLGRCQPGDAGASLAQLRTELAAGGADVATGQGNDLAWCRLFQLQAFIEFAQERAGNAVESLRLALARARALDDQYETQSILCAICELAQWAPTPVTSGLAVCDELAARFDGNRPLLVPVLLTRARLIALAGDLPAARQALATARVHAAELHLDIAEAAAAEVAGLVESLAGAHDKAEACYRQAEAIVRAGGPGHDAPTLAVAWARALFEQGRLAEARAALADLTSGQGETDLRTTVMATALRGRLALQRAMAPCRWPGRPLNWPAGPRISACAPTSCSTSRSCSNRRVFPGPPGPPLPKRSRAARLAGRP